MHWNFLAQAVRDGELNEVKTQLDIVANGYKRMLQKQGSLCMTVAAVASNLCFVP